MNKNKVLGIISIALSAVVVFATSRLRPPMQLAKGDPGPWLFPGVAAALLAICGICLLFDKTGASKTFLNVKEWKRAGLLFALLVVYAIAIVLFGFLYPSIVILFVFCTLFAGETKVKLYVRILYAVILGVGIWYLLSEVFKVALPTGTLLG